MSSRTNILNVPIDSCSTEDFLNLTENFIASKTSHQIVTVNAEFLVAAQNDDVFRAILNESAINTADGIGVVWSAGYLNLPFRWKRFRRLEALIQLIFTGLAVLFSRRSLRSPIIQKLSGVDLVWKLCALAAKKNYSVYLLGGFGNTPQMAAERLLERYPALRLAGFYGGSPEEPEVLKKLERAKPDILFVAFGPVRQEKWIAENREKLRIPAVMGVGGTLDYLAQKKPLAPHFLRENGLEWAYRLVTQPHRIKRVFTAVFVFAAMVYRYKLLSPEYRRNVLGCIINKQGRVLVCNRRIANHTDKTSEHWQFPQGGIELGESVASAFVREMKEEVGLSDLKILKIVPDALTYEFPLRVAERYHHGSFRGQKQTFIYASTEKPDSVKIDLDEFIDFKWVKPEELLKVLHPIRRKTGAIVISHLE